MDWREYTKNSTKGRHKNLANAMPTFEQAQALAKQHGFELYQHSFWHFSLMYSPSHYISASDWRWNLYPSNQRIYADPHYKSPFLRIENSPWTFLDIVEAAIKIKRAENEEAKTKPAGSG